MEFSLSWDGTQGPDAWTPAQLSPRERFPQGLARGRLPSSQQPDAFLSFSLHPPGKAVALQPPDCLLPNNPAPQAALQPWGMEGRSPEPKAGAWGWALSWALLLGPWPFPLALPLPSHQAIPGGPSGTASAFRLPWSGGKMCLLHASQVHGLRKKPSSLPGAG